MKRLGIVDGEQLVLRKNGELFEYHLGEKFIGVYNPKVMEDRILFREDSKENVLSAEIKDKVQKVVDEQDREIFQEKEYNREEVLELERQLGFENGRYIKRIREIDLGQKVKTNEKDISKAKEVKDNTQAKAESINTLNDVTVKQEMDLDNKTTDMKRLGQLLEAAGKIPKDGKKYEKLGVVESDEINKAKTEEGKTVEGNTTRYQFVLIDNEGNKTPIDLEPDHQEGDNPREENLTVNANGKVEQNAVLSRYKIGEGTIAIDNEQYGEIKAYYSPRKTIGGDGIEGNKSLDTELETTNVWETDKEIRDLSGEYDTGYRSVEEGYQEAKNGGHIKSNGEPCDKAKVKEVDGDEETKSHDHINEEMVQQLARKILDENEDLAEVYNMDDIEKRIRAEINIDGEKDINKIKEKIVIKAKEDAELEHEQPQRDKRS